MTILAYAVVLTLCQSGASLNQSQDDCHDFHIEVKEHRFEAVNSLIEQGELMGLAWLSEESTKAVAAYIKPFNTGMDARHIVDYDFTIQPLHENDFP